MARVDPLAELVAALQRLPGIGAKSAQRLAYHLLKTPREEVDALCNAMATVKDRVTYCATCGNITDVDPCSYCTAPDRDSRLICVVEQPENIASIERTRGFRGPETEPPGGSRAVGTAGAGTGHSRSGITTWRLRS